MEEMTITPSAENYLNDLLSSQDDDTDGIKIFVSEPGTNKKPDPSRKVSAKIQQKIQEAGVILRSLPGDSLAFCPPLIIEESQIHEMFDKIDSVLVGIDFQNL